MSGFFEFYSSFNFGDSVISPFLGKSLDRDLFDPDNADDPNIKIELAGMERYLENVWKKNMEHLPTKKGMCVQDPFELNRNVINIPADAVARFQVNFPPSSSFLHARGLVLAHLHADHGVLVRNSNTLPA